MKTNGAIPRQQARMVMHEDEHAIIKAMLRRAIGDDDFFGRFVSGVRSESGRTKDRVAIARFLERMERHFELRANGHRLDPLERSEIEIPLYTQAIS